MSPVNRLVEAAARLDALARSATAEPWAKDASTWTLEGVYGACSTVDAAYIAAMHPGVGKALAAWLRTEARYNGSVLREPYLSDPTTAIAQMVAVADAVLAGTE